MKPKILILILLLLIIVVSGLTLILRQRPRGADPGELQGAGAALPNDRQAPSDPALPEKPSALRQDGVLVYYFHGDVRCPTCRAIEALSHEAVQKGFARALEEGALEWHVVNVEEEGNDHFIKDYQIFTSSLVIQKISDGNRDEWKNLEKVWDLVRDEAAFAEYVQGEIRTLMGTR